MADLDDLARRFRESGNDQTSRSPFCAGLHRQIAEHPEIVQLLQSAPEQQQLPVLLLAAVHDLVLAEPDAELAQWYPTVTEVPDPTDPFPAFARFCREHADRLRHTIATRVTQTNEVGRAALFLPALGLIAAETGDLALVDVGTSAGLNLQLDRFGYRYSPGGVIAGESGVTIDTGTRGDVPVPSSAPTVVGRFGLDRSPIDVSVEREARWLTACVWPDQPDRFERLSSAIELAARHPPVIRVGDAVDDVAGLIDEAATVGHPVVMNSWVLNYLPHDRRVAYVERLDRIGAGRDLSWVYAESPGLCAGVPFAAEVAEQHVTALTLVRWRDGVRTLRHLGVAHPHGYWLHWAEPGARPAERVINP